MCSWGLLDDGRHCIESGQSMRHRGPQNLVRPVELMCPRLESREDLVNRCGQGRAEDELLQARAQFEFGGDPQAAGIRPSIRDEKAQHKFSEHRVRRTHVEPFGALKHCGRRKSQVNGPHAQYLLDVQHLRFAAQDTCRDPPAQELRIALDIGCNIENLLAAVGQRSPESLYAQS